MENSQERSAGPSRARGDSASGAETAVLSMLKATLIHGMIIQGRHYIKCYGPTAVDSPDKKDLESCNELGMRVASLATALKA